MLEELSVSREGVLVHAQLVHDLIAILPAQDTDNEATTT